MPDDSPLAPREAVAGKDARTFAREILQMTQPEFWAAFKGWPMKRAKLRGLKRNAAEVLGDGGAAERRLAQSFRYGRGAGRKIA